MHITMLLPGFGYPSPVICPYEVFVSAGNLWQVLVGQDDVTSPFEVVTASIDGEPVEYLGGVTITPDKAVRQIRRTDVVFIPSLGLDLDTVLATNADMVDFVRREAMKGTLIAGVCTGVAMMAHAGLLDGRTATTHWALSGAYQDRFPDVDWKTDLFITRCENLVTGGGVYASLDVCLYLVEQLAGFEIAKQCARALLIDGPRTWQSSFSAPLLKQQHHDERIRLAQEYLDEHFNTPFTMEELSDRLGMSARNFTRRFKQATGETPLAYLHKLRINRAKQLLESDYRSVQEVCFEVGYEDVPFFRSIFKRYAGLAPRDYKQQFGRPPLEAVR